MDNKLYEYLLMLGDNSMILGHRLSELCGHGPNLETDIALTNISLDLFGQVRNYFQYAVKVNPAKKSEDNIAFLRYPNEYRNVLLVEQPNTDFAYIIARQFFYDSYHLPLLQQLSESQDTQIKAIANKSIKEVRYHTRFSSEWIKRLGDGTEESHDRIQRAIDYLYPYAKELMEESMVEKEMLERGIGTDLSIVKDTWEDSVATILKESTLELPEIQSQQSGGKRGVHSEHLGYILTDLQYMQRTYPEMAW